MLLSADGEVCPEVGLLLFSSDSVSVLKFFPGPRHPFPALGFLR